MKFTTFTLAITLMMASSCRAATNWCKPDSHVTVISDSASNATVLEETFERFRSILGGENNGNTPTPQQTGHRQINWDADIVPFDMPGDFFHLTVTRGLELIPQQDRIAAQRNRRQNNQRGNNQRLNEVRQQQFLVSNDDSGDDRFDSINAVAAEDFSFFSPSRLFSFTREETLTIVFHEAGSGENAPLAGVRGFGAVFVDVDLPNETKMVAKDESGCVITEQYVEPFDEGLSFLGLFVPERDIYTIKIYIPTTIDEGVRRARDANVRGARATAPEESNFVDYVVLDDFLYDEPRLN